MNIDSIKNGIVIDHIKAGLSMDIFEFLNLEELDAPVKILRKMPSTKMGRKDVIKIDSELDVDLNALGYIDPDISINIIKDGKVVDKYYPTLPETMTNILKCKNPRCITSCEQELDHIFKLTDSKNRVYRCIYCETKSDLSKL